jgi:hypothetical protein
MSFNSFTMCQEQIESSRNPQSLCSVINDSSPCRKRMMGGTDMSSLSLESALMGINLTRKQRVRFALPRSFDPSFMNAVVAESEDHNLSPPPKRRRFERRNSQTASMLFAIQRDFNKSMSSIQSLDDSCSSIDTWDIVTDPQLEIAEQLVREIKKQQQKR